MNIIEIEKYRNFNVLDNDNHYHHHFYNRRNNNEDNENGIKFMSEEDNKILWNDIRKSKATDLVNLTLSDYVNLITLGETLLGIKNDDIHLIPSDIIFMGTIPIIDMVIIEEFDDIKTTEFRVVIFPDYQERIRNSETGESVRIGCIIGDFYDNDYVVTTLNVRKGNSFLFSEERFGHKLPDFILEGIPKRKDVNRQNVYKSFCMILSAWYVIQISCLHPVTKDVFSNPKTAVYETKTKNKNNRKRNKIKYIKKHIISTDINKLISNNSSNYTRKTLSWYVTGHWRIYKTGKKVFIKPYWKGVLRESKNAEIREREVDTTKVNID